jgi:Trp operon repressor
MSISFQIRQECPAGACICNRQQLLSDEHSDIRILRLTRDEEKKLVNRLENIADLADLQHMLERMHALLGISMTVTPGPNEVRTVRGLQIDMADMPGLCNKTRQTLPAAIRRGLDRNPQIVYELLNSYDLLGNA